jgi:hypothetical protein
MNRLFEAVDNQKFFTLNEARVTDYIDSDRLGEIISTNPILSTFNDCEPIEGMVLKMTGDMGVSYYKVIKNDDYTFEAYLIDQSGRQLGDAFPLEGLELDESAKKYTLDDLKWEQIDDEPITYHCEINGWYFNVYEEDGEFSVIADYRYDEMQDLDAVFNSLDAAKEYVLKILNGEDLDTLE